MMSSTEAEKRISELLSKSEDAAKGGELQKAFEALKEGKHFSSAFHKSPSARATYQDN